ncbi:MAG: ABC transporter ATP-binding protein [Endomicrobia bacterium]|nr:ABC transporter ATP-binding protein [Endomicrobiia bacterium]MCL2799683.1 ABC transporter ATP-binding protein [Endomicrobiia bacterium]
MDEVISIEVKNLVKKYGDFEAVKDISFDVKKGEIFAFLGPNGAGKTTTVKILTGLLKPSSGEVSVLGMNVSRDIDKIKSKIGFVPDQPYVYPYLTAFEYMRMIGDVYKVPVEKQQKMIPEMFEMFELDGRSSEIIDSFSHGMKQKLVISGVLLHAPEIMFLDEPLVGLDPRSAKLVKDIFAKLARNGTTIFMCTHVLDIAQKLSDRICIINGGKILALDTFENLQKRVDSQSDLESVYLDITEGVS